MSRAYFAADGSYGDAAGLVVLDTSNITPETWDYLEGLTDSHRYAVALAMSEAQTASSAESVSRCVCGFCACDYKLDGYAPGETVCGACLDNCATSSAAEHEPVTA